MNTDIYRIASLISEDPDIILEEQQQIVVTYTNIYGETKKYAILKAYFSSAGNSESPHFLIVWPNRSFGILTGDGLSSLSLAKLKEIALPYQEFCRLKYQRAKASRKINKYRKSKAKWEYMWRHYPGRCCPSWHRSDHVTGDEECYRNSNSEDYVKHYAGWVNPETGVVPDKPAHSIPMGIDRGLNRRGESNIIGAYNTDYGLIRVTRHTEGYAVIVTGEDPTILSSREETIQHIKDNYDYDLESPKH